MQLSFSLKPTPLGRWAVGPLGRWAVGPLGRWAVGPLGRWAVGPLGRWAVGPLGRWAVGPLVLSALCGMSSAVQAQAPSPDGDSGPVPGVWRRYYKVISGKATGHSDGADKNYVFNFATGDYEVGDNHGYGSASVASGGAGGDLSSYGYGAGASAKTEDVKVKVTYKWEPQGSYPAGTQVAPPDPKLNFLLRGSAYVRVNGGNEKAFASVNGKNSSANATIFASAGATRLFSLDTKGQTELSGTMPMGVAGSGKGSVNAAFEFSSGFDDRSVSLSRVGAHDEWIEGDVTHGDTIYSYDFFGMDGARPQMNTQHLVASLGGDWTTRTHYRLDNGQAYVVKGDNHQWSPNPDAPNLWDHWNHASYTMPHGNLNFHPSGWNGSPTGQAEKTITYTVKDNRNNEGEIVAEPKYILHIHDPVELIRETSSRVTVNAVLRGSNGKTIDTPNEPGGVKAGSKTIETGVSSSEGVAVGASFDVSQFIAFLGLDFQYSVQDETSLSTSATLDQDIPEGQYSYAMVTHVYKRVHQHLYKYDAGGRNVRMGRLRETDDGYNDLKEVPHEAFADEYLHATTPFWSGPIDTKQFPPTPDPLPPFKSTYTS